MAARYWVGGNANWDNTAGTKWSLTSGGAGGQAVPTASDDVFLDNGTGTGNVTVANSSVCKTLNCTGYVGTLAGSSGLTISGSVTFSSGMTLTNTATWTINSTATMTSAGKIFTGNLTFTGTADTFTMADDWTVNGTMTVQGSTTTTVNGSNIYCKTNLTVNSPTTSGTTNFHLTGTGTWSSSFSSRTLRNNLTINTAGTITITGTILYNTGTLTYTAGTVTATGSTLSIGASVTLNTNGIIWNNITITVAVTITNNSLLTATGLLNYSANANIVFAGTAGFTVGSFNLVNGGRTHTFVSGATYTITTAFTCTIGATAAAHTVLVSSTGGSQAIFTVQGGATIDLDFLDATDLDSSLGRTIWTYKGTLSNATNWRQIQTPMSVSYSG